MNNPETGLRHKYLEALQRLETGEARWAKLENVLRLTIGRLCLAARGRSGRLDGELRGLSDLIRRQPSAEELEACLDPLSRAIAALDRLPDAAATPSATPNGSPAEAAPPPPATSSSTASTQASAPAQPPASARASGPPQARAPAQDPTPPQTATGPQSLAPPAEPSPAPERDAHIQVAIVAMLERLASLPELRPVLAELQERPGAALTADELAEGLERVARMIGEQRSRLQHEKLEVEDLLRQIDTRLEELGSYLTGDAADQKNAQESTQQLNLLVMDEMHELNTDIQRAIDLAELRSRVRVRLETITTHLQDFRAREDQRFASQTDRTGRLRVRIAELERESRNLQQSLQEEQRLAMVDALTGIANRAAYDERIQHEFTLWNQEGGPVSILAWDIDRFKDINDAYGHRAGDKVLRVIGQHLAQHVRGTDFVARYGGEEFVMILVGTGADQALVAADKIRTGIARIGFHFRNRPVTVTASCGITTFHPDDTPDMIFDRADRALYRAKDAGRNCCVVM
jgi:diguanylate cyclase